MTPAQRATVGRLLREGYQLVGQRRGRCLVLVYHRRRP